MRVLLVEGDRSSASSLLRILTAAGMVVDHADTGEETCGLAKFYDYNIILLDLKLPDIDGYEVLRRMRAARIETPVVVLCGPCQPQAKVKALALGADDFITKPFDKEELLARISAVVRRSKGFSQAMLQVGRLQLNQEGRQLLVNGKEVHVTGKEYAILELMVLRKGMVLSKETFLNHLYGGMDEPEMKIIDVFICKLRKKLAVAGAPDMITTVWGQGYIMRDGADMTAQAQPEIAEPAKLMA